MAGHVLYHPYKNGDLLVQQFNKLIGTNFTQSCPPAKVDDIAARWPVKEKTHGEEWRRYYSNFASFVSEKIKYSNFDSL